MIDLIEAAQNNEKHENYTFFLDGDLSQMSSQKRFLNERGISTKQNNVYPCLRQSDVKEALTLIWEQRCDGWWHYCKYYVEFGICTKEEFNNRLQRS